MDIDITASVDMGPERMAGILVHPTSFPGPYGIGDLGKGAYDFIDFMEKSGMKLWQVLPLGHTGFGDSPYQPFSSSLLMNNGPAGQRLRTEHPTGGCPVRSGLP